jgi:Protein of unknown function (DUF2778)
VWKYVQSNGQLFFNSDYVETGYSGSSEGRNDSSKECERNVGPIPRGYYNIGSERSNPTAVTLPLTADDPSYCNPTRDGFLIHGDNTSGTASTGCIVIGRITRERIRDSGDIRLRVVQNSLLSKEVRRERFAGKGEF